MDVLVLLMKKKDNILRCARIIALERDQFVDILLQEVEGHLAFDVLEIPHSILTQVYELIVEKLRAEADANKTTYRIVFSKDFNIEKDIFDSLKKLLTAEEKQCFPSMVTRKMFQYIIYFY